MADSRFAQIRDHIEFIEFVDSKQLQFMKTLPQTPTVIAETNKLRETISSNRNSNVKLLCALDKMLQQAKTIRKLARQAQKKFKAANKINYISVRTYTSFLQRHLSERRKSLHAIMDIFSRALAEYEQRYRQSLQLLADLIAFEEADGKSRINQTPSSTSTSPSPALLQKIEI